MRSGIGNHGGLDDRRVAKLMGAVGGTHQDEPWQFAFDPYVRPQTAERQLSLTRGRSSRRGDGTSPTRSATPKRKGRWVWVNGKNGSGSPARSLTPAPRESVRAQPLIGHAGSMSVSQPGSSSLATSHRGSYTPPVPHATGSYAPPLHSNQGGSWTPPVPQMHGGSCTAPVQLHGIPDHGTAAGIFGSLPVASVVLQNIVASEIPVATAVVPRATVEVPMATVEVPVATATVSPEPKVHTRILTEVFPPNYAASTVSLGRRTTSPRASASFVAAAPRANTPPTPPQVLERPVYIDRIVERIVEKPVYIDRVVEKVVEKIVDRPVYIQSGEHHVRDVEHHVRPLEGRVYAPPVEVAYSDRPFYVNAPAPSVVHTELPGTKAGNDFPYHDPERGAHFVGHEIDGEGFFSDQLEDLYNMFSSGAKKKGRAGRRKT